MQGAFEFYRDLPARPKRPERLFFGLFPDSETSLRIDAFRQHFCSEHRFDGKPLKRDRLHTSLHRIGDFRRLRTSVIFAARQAGSAVAMRRFEISFGSVKSFEAAPSKNGEPRNRPLVLLGRGDGLSALHAMLGAAMRAVGLKAAEHFVPHMTLAYGRRLIPMQTIEPICIAVDRFVLIHSKLGLTEYEVIDRWRLED